MKLRILSAVLAVTALLQLTGCCCLRDRWCAKRHWRYQDQGCCQPSCCESRYAPAGEPPIGRTVHQVQLEH